jgi:hypothetical protein
VSGVECRVSGVGCRVAEGRPVPCGVCQAGDPVDSPVTWASAPADAAAVARDVSDRADGGCGKARPLRGFTLPCGVSPFLSLPPHGTYRFFELQAKSCCPAEAFVRQ